MMDELEQAIGRNDLEAVKRVLMSGNNNKYKSGFNRYLHIATTAEINRELLLHGANVNARWMDYLTPLHAAIMYKKELQIVKDLIAFGANINAEVGITCFTANALSLAVYFSKSEIMEEILDHSELSVTEDDILRFSHYPPFRAAYANFIAKSKSIIESSLLKSIDKTEENKDVKRFRKFPPLQRHIEKGEKELFKIKLYDFGKFKITNLNKLWKYNLKTLGIFINDFDEFKDLFPLFNNAIIERVETEFERRKLLQDLKKLTLTDSGHQVVLNRCCLRDIADYLDNKDLSNLTKALQ